MIMLRRLVAALATFALAAFEIQNAWMMRVPETKLLSAGFGLALVGLGLGIVRRRHGARLVAMGGAVAGATQMLAFAGLAPWASAWWPFATFGLLCALVVLSLSGRRMAEHFHAHLAPASTWRLDGTPTRVLAGVVVACAAAVPMLLLYGHMMMMGGAAGRAAVALVSALGLTLAGVLVLFERTAGLLLLVPFASTAAVAAFDAAAWVAIFGHHGVYTSTLASLLPALSLGVVVPTVGFLVFTRPLARYLRHAE